MFIDVGAIAGVVIVLSLCVVTILVIGIFNIFQLSRTREMREDIRELRYYIVQLSHRINVDLGEVTPPERRHMPFIDRGYWRTEHDPGYTLPGHMPSRRWP